MHPIDAYQMAVRIADDAVQTKYKTAEWSVGSAAHTYWLSIFDVAFKNLLAKED